jgi:hypothetical protein
MPANPTPVTSPVKVTVSLNARSTTVDHVDLLLASGKTILSPPLASVKLNTPVLPGQDGQATFTNVNFVGAPGYPYADYIVRAYDQANTPVGDSTVYTVSIKTPVPTVTSTTFAFTSVTSPAGTFTDFTNPITVSSPLTLKGAVTAGTTAVARLELRTGLPGGTSSPVPGASVNQAIAAQATLNVELAGVDFSLLGPGTYPVFLRAYDAAGTAVGESQGITLIVSSTAPPALTGGTIVGWGSNLYGELNVPAGLMGVQAIAAGHYNSLALKSDGTVVGWGSNDYGQLNVPAGLKDVKAIAGGSGISVALKNDGTVVAWGCSINTSSLDCTVPAGLTGVTAIAVGLSNTLALKSDGTVVGWGYSYNNVLAVPAGLTNIRAIATGSDHSVALKNDGTVVAWGANNVGQATVPVGLTNVKAIAAGGAHSLALKDDGTVVAWGYNDNGQATVPAGLTGVTAIAASLGQDSGLALRLGQ